jgi:hypothetical protein
MRDHPREPHKVILAEQVAGQFCGVSLRCENRNGLFASSRAKTQFQYGRSFRRIAATCRVRARNTVCKLLPNFGHDAGTRSTVSQATDFEALPGEKSGFYVIVYTRDKAEDAPGRLFGLWPGDCHCYGAVKTALAHF